MKRSELEALGLSKEHIDQIMEAHGRTVTEIKTQNEALQNTITELTGRNVKLEAEFSDFKKSKMTEEERRTVEVKEQEAARASALQKAQQAEMQYKALIQKTKVKDFLVNGGITAQDADKFVDTLVGQTEEESIGRAKTFVEFVNTQKQTSATKAVEDAAKKTPQPQGGSAPDNQKKPFEPNKVW